MKVLQQVLPLLLLIVLIGCKTDTTDTTDTIDTTDITYSQGNATAAVTTSNSATKPDKNYIAIADLHSYVKSAPIIKRPKNLGKPFNTLNFNKVIAYDYEGSEEPYPSIIEKDDFNPVVLKQQALTERQVSYLVKTLATTSSYGDKSAQCFIPHLSFVFFNDDKIVYTIDICLDCNGIAADTDIPAKEAIQLAYPFGFSKAGKKQICELCTELGFFYGSESYLKMNLPE